jgi:hypothetical protein
LSLARQFSLLQTPPPRSKKYLMPDFMEDNSMNSQNGLIASIKKLITEEFYRDLISVIIGIIVTFGGSALIQRCSEHKETRHALSMVRDELSGNLDMIELQKKRLAHEKRGSMAMLPYLHDPHDMPADSLDKYLDILSRSHYFALPDNSFAMLKSSQQIEKIGNKEMLRDLFSIYANMEHFQSSIHSHNSLKDGGISDYYSGLDSDLYQAMYKEADEGNAPYMIFSDMVSRSVLLRNYIVSTANGSNDYLVPRTDSLIAQTEMVIDLINKEVKNK